MIEIIFSQLFFLPKPYNLNKAPNNILYYGTKWG